MSSDTYSATTPVWRRFTSSMNAGGKDHSRPTRRPIFCSIGRVLRGWLGEHNAPGAAVHLRLMLLFELGPGLLGISLPVLASNADAALPFRDPLAKTGKRIPKNPEPNSNRATCPQ